VGIFSAGLLCVGAVFQSSQVRLPVFWSGTASVMWRNGVLEYCV
jgi:hypothetical protein